MTNHAHDANDGSVQEIAVNHENPISNEHPSHPKSRSGSPAHSAPFEGIPISVCTLPTDQSGPWEIVDEGAAPFTRHSQPILRKAVTAETAANKIVKIGLDRLLAHPLNRKLFGETSPDEIKVLAESIAEAGQISPLVVTADLEKLGCYTLLSGHKRAAAMKTLGWTEANCQLVDVTDADERAVCLLEANRQHKPTTEQNLRIGELYFELETKKAKARQVAGAKAKKGDEVVETLPQPAAQTPKAGDDATGKARDIAAAKVGMSGVSFDKGRKVLRAMEKAEEEGKTASVTRLREMLNEKGIDPAYEHAKVLDLIEKVSRKTGGAGGKAQGTGVVAKGDSSNPVPAAVVPQENSPAPASTVQVIDVHGTNTATKPKENPSSMPVQVQVQAQVEDDTEQPLGAHAIAIGKKFVEALAELEVADLTADLKGNLARTLDDVSDWQANHDQMLKLPGQL